MKDLMFNKDKGNKTAPTSYTTFSPLAYSII